MEYQYDGKCIRLDPQAKIPRQRRDDKAEQRKGRKSHEGMHEIAMYTSAVTSSIRVLSFALHTDQDDCRQALGQSDRLGMLRS